MEFLQLSRRRSCSRNVPGGEERGETDVFAGYSKNKIDNNKLEEKRKKAYLQIVIIIKDIKNSGTLPP